MSTEVSIKPLSVEYEAYMWDLLYRSIFKAKTNENISREIKDLPDLKKYVENYGSRDGDLGYIVLNDKNQPVGAVWIRYFDDDYNTWGYVDSKTPEMNIALEDGYRGEGLGGKMIDKMFESLPDCVEQISISIHPENRCVSLYSRKGFVEIEKRDPAIVMLKKCKKSEN